MTQQIVIPLPHTAAGVPLVQTGPSYQCFGCGAPVVIGLQWFTHPTNPSPIDRYAAHVWYLQNTLGHKCPCHKRVARLGDCITPLEWQDPRFAANWQQAVEANALAVAAALEQLAAYAPVNGRGHDPATRIVYALLTHEVPPAQAIEAIRDLLKGRAA